MNNTVDMNNTSCYGIENYSAYLQPCVLYLQQIPNVYTYILYIGMYVDVV